MKPTNKHTFPVTVGTSLILVAFVILCLVAFAVLSFSGADADYRLTKKAVSHALDNYAAENDAETQLSELDNLLSEIWTANPDSDRFLRTLAEKTSLNNFTVSSEADRLLLTLLVPVNDKENLRVECLVTTAHKAQGFFDIITYKTEPAQNEPDNQTIQQNGGLLF